MGRGSMVPGRQVRTTFYNWKGSICVFWASLQDAVDGEAPQPLRMVAPAYGLPIDLWLCCSARTLLDAASDLVYA